MPQKAKRKKIPEYVLMAVAKALDPHMFTAIRYKWSGSHVARVKRIRKETLVQARKAIRAYEKAKREHFHEKR